MMLLQLEDCCLLCCVFVRLCSVSVWRVLELRRPHTLSMPKSVPQRQPND